MKQNRIKQVTIGLSMILIWAFHSNTANAQIKVHTTGDVSVGTTNSWFNSRLFIYGSSATQSAIYAGGTGNSSKMWAANSYHAYALGIDGSVGHIYRDINNPQEVMSFRNNGYVAIGKSYPYYKLDVNGDINATRIRVNGTIIHDGSSSEKLLKSLGKINKLTPISYKIKEEIIETDDKGNTQSKIEESIAFGLDVKSLREEFPELVMEKNGQASIDYISLIPVILEGMKEQNATISEQQSTINDLKSTIDGLKNELKVKSTSASFGETKLYQNTPNPFSKDTEIKVNIDQNVNDAILFIYDMQGKQIKSIAINQKGESSITIYGSELEAGMYYYALVVEGKEVETKKMILTE